MRSVKRSYQSYLTYHGAVALYSYDYADHKEKMKAPKEILLRRIAFLLRDSVYYAFINPLCVRTNAQ